MWNNGCTVLLFHLFELEDVQSLYSQMVCRSLKQGHQIHHAGVSRVYLICIFVMSAPVLLLNILVLESANCGRGCALIV